MKQSEYIQSSNIYSFRKALEANYFLTPEQQEQTMLFCYFHQNDFPVSMHSHEFYEINIITEGRGTHYIEDNGFSIKSGDFFIIPPNIRLRRNRKPQNLPHNTRRLFLYEVSRRSPLHTRLFPAFQHRAATASQEQTQTVSQHKRGRFQVLSERNQQIAQAQQVGGTHVRSGKVR